MNRMGPWAAAMALLLGGCALFAAIAAAVFRWLGLYRGIWRFASFPDLARIMRASTLIVLFHLAAMFAFTRLEDYPRSALVIAWFVLGTMLGGS